MVYLRCYSRVFQNALLDLTVHISSFIPLSLVFYHDIKLDYGSILRMQLIQKTSSSTRNTEISGARFSSLIVHRPLVHFKIPSADDVLVAVIPILQTSSFMMSDPTNFTFVGSIPEQILFDFPDTLKTNPKVNEASGSKGKERIIDDDEEEEVLSDGEELVRKKRDKELDDILILHKELEGKEVEARVAKGYSRNKNVVFFPLWSLKRIQKEAINDPSIHWLEPSVAFELNNTTDSELDFPLTPKAFPFRGFAHIKKASFSDYNVNNMLFSFYLKHG
ncbi:unnamed protein product [Lactuca saligna]|uniref:Uncharacterized protein n=1 Tax=Lactuca saligna TaxID=75948 RepID=A0AA35V7U9_LACSI|nr:unnamed protein product [Lactuca saligna]